jgi:predicted O-methyltransferase YrrM
VPVSDREKVGNFDARPDGGGEIPINSMDRGYRGLARPFAVLAPAAERRHNGIDGAPRCALRLTERRSELLESETVDSACLGDGTEFSLVRSGNDWSVRVGTRLLMSSRMHGSEEALAEQALARANNPRAILVGGLGLGFTLRAVLRCVHQDAKVTVGELLPELVEWNRSHVGALADHPLADSRVEVVVGDVFDTIQRSAAAFDVILLDVDNGPIALTQARNQRLYGDRGVHACHTALRSGGVLALWSTGPNARFERKLIRAGFAVEVIRVSAREGSRARHVLFLAKDQGDQASRRGSPAGNRGPSSR